MSSDQRPHPVDLLRAPTGLPQQTQQERSTRLVMPPPSPLHTRLVPAQPSTPNSRRPLSIHPLKRRSRLATIVHPAKPSEKQPPPAPGKRIQHSLRRRRQKVVPHQLRNRRSVQKMRKQEIRPPACLLARFAPQNPKLPHHDLLVPEPVLPLHHATSYNPAP